MNYDGFTEDEEFDSRTNELRYLRNDVPVRIIQDEDGSYANPREHTNVGTFVHWHRRYELGDEQMSGQLDEAMSRGYQKGGMAGGLAMLTRYLTLMVGAKVVLPVSLLDHSGLTVWVGGGPHWSDTAGWDSGTVGVIYDTPESREETGVPDDKIEEQLRVEIAEYDKWLRGEVYGYIVGDENLDVTDSCWGFIGLDVVQEAAGEAADALRDDLIEKRRIVAACMFKPESFEQAQVPA